MSASQYPVSLSGFAPSARSVPVAAMSSREIADLTGKTHYHVLRDIRDVLAKIYTEKDHPESDDLDSKGFSIEKDARGYVACIYLDKNLTLTLLTGYDVKARYKVVCRWQELEAGTSAIPDFSNPAAAARAWADAYEAKQLAEQKIAVLEQHVETERPYTELGHLLASEDSIYLRDFVALLKDDIGAGFGERQLTKFLIDKKYCYRAPNEGKGLFSYAQHQDLFKRVRESNGKSRYWVLRVTGKGVEVLTPIIKAAYNKLNP